MKALVSRRNCLLVLRRRACVRLGLLTFVFGPFAPQPSNVSIGLAGVPAVHAGKASGVVPDPVLWPGPEDQPSAIAANREPVSGAKAEFTEQMGWQGYLVLAAYGTRGFLRAARKVSDRSFPYLNCSPPLGFILHPL